MHWFTISIIGAITWGIVTVLDKRILSSYEITAIIYFSWIGLISIIYLPLSVTTKKSGK